MIDVANSSVDLQNWQIVVGFLTPIILSVIIQPTWSKRVQSLIAFVWAVIVSLVVLLLQGDLNGRSWYSSALVIFVFSIGTYHGLWKPTAVAPAIESATSFSRRDANDVI